MVVNSQERAKAREAFRLANDLHLDLIVATGLYAKLAGLDQELLRVGGARQCLFVIALTLVKWVDYYNHFSQVLPPSVRDVAKQLKADCDGPGLRRFRNVVAAHLKDESGRIPSTGEVEEILRQMTGGDLPAFLDRINDLGGTNNGTVVLRIEAITDAIRAENRFNDADLTE